LADDTTALLADDTTALLAEGGYAFDDDYLPMSELVEDEALVSPLILLERMLQGLSNLSREIVIDALLKRITHKTYQRYRMAQIRDVSQPDLPSLKIIRQLRSKVVRTHRLCQYQCPRSRFDRDESSITRSESFRWMSPLSSIPQYLMKLDTFEHFSPHLSVPTISDGPIVGSKYSHALHAICPGHTAQDERWRRFLINHDEGVTWELYHDFCMIHHIPPIFFIGLMVFMDGIAIDRRRHSALCVRYTCCNLKEEYRNKNHAWHELCVVEECGTEPSMAILKELVNDALALQKGIRILIDGKEIIIKGYLHHIVCDGKQKWINMGTPRGGHHPCTWCHIDGEAMIFADKVGMKRRFSPLSEDEPIDTISYYDETNPLIHSWVRDRLIFSPPDLHCGDLLHDQELGMTLDTIKLFECMLTDPQQKMFNDRLEAFGCRVRLGGGGREGSDCAEFRAFCFPCIWELDRISVRGNATFSFLYDGDRYADEELSTVGRTSILRVNPKKRSVRRRGVTTETHGHLRFKDVLFMTAFGCRVRLGGGGREGSDCAEFRAFCFPCIWELDRISVRGNATFSFLYDGDRYADEELSTVGRTSILRVNPKKRSVRRRGVTTETHGHLRFKDVLFMTVSLDDYVLKMAMAKPGEDVNEIIELARIHRAIWIPLCVLARVISTNRGISKVKPHYITHIEEWIEKCGSLRHYSAQLAAEVLPFLHISESDARVPDICFKEDDYYFFDSANGVIKYQSCVDGIAKGTIYTYFGEQVELACRGYGANIIGLYIYSLTADSGYVALARISEKTKAATAGQLKYEGIDSTKLIVPVRSRK
ncbi:hypothetical protein ADUPG1_000370, partial [Aduncisulcus paluster]